MILRNFTPYASVSAAPTGASAVTALPVQATVAGGPTVSRGTTVLLQNVGTVLVYFRFSPAVAVTADANSTALQPGCAMVFDIGTGDAFALPVDGSQGPITGVALFAPAGTGNINIVMGIGS